LSVTRRSAREAALRILYEVELGRATIREALNSAVEELQMEPMQAAYAERLVLGIKETHKQLDPMIASFVHGYDFTRLAELDRNILRIAAYELVHVPEIPPAVSIDEAIEIAKRYSTAESGRFINGVLGALVRNTAKANWDPATAPQEIMEEPAPAPQAVEIEEIEVSPDDDSFKVASRIGGWKLRE
jgi:transcription antitermination protein NusB